MTAYAMAEVIRTGRYPNTAARGPKAICPIGIATKEPSAS